MLFQLFVYVKPLSVVKPKTNRPSVQLCRSQSSIYLSIESPARLLWKGSAAGWDLNGLAPFFNELAVSCNTHNRKQIKKTMGLNYLEEN